MSNSTGERKRKSDDRLDSAEQVTERHADADVDSQLRRFESGLHGCKHYRRRVKFVSPCWYEYMLIHL